MTKPDKLKIKFGSWTIIDRDENNRCLSECKCGKQEYISYNRLILGETVCCQECSKKKYGIYIGQHFGEWEVISDVDSKYKVLCKCSCGKTRKINIYTLKNGRSTSCGHTMNQDRVLDLTGRQFGELEAIKYLGNSLWGCKCLCGNTVVRRRDHLLDGRAQSCGHGTSKEPIDMIGKRFGKLKAIKYMGKKSWLCECDCGNKKIILGANLRNGSTLSCGCINYSTTKEHLIEVSNKYYSEHNIRPSISDFSDIEEISYKAMNYHLSKHGIIGTEYIDTIYSSKGERELYKFILSYTTDEVLHNVTSVISPFELDIYIPSKKLAIEYNGDYWHSELNKNSTYHKDKTIACAKKGIRLIHVFEHEWKDIDKQKKIKNIIRLALNSSDIKRIYARNTDIIEINNQEAVKFCNDNHLQGGVQSAINIALIDRANKSILGVVTFGKPRFNSECQYELLRLVFKTDISIIGGSEKLFSYFISKYNPESILSYCDTSKFNGGVYLRLGFDVIEYTQPGYIWASMSGGKSTILSRYQTTKQILIENGLGTEDETEASIMHKMNYYRIYDCGNLKFKWKRSR